ncbi:hypothetical protein MCSV2_90021 [Mucispirillum schaedleri ASF457]|nr:hypothetical protein MCSV2_90021 [Mucispirillum schaedleri ASF457]
MCISHFEPDFTCEKSKLFIIAAVYKKFKLFFFRYLAFYVQ